MNILEQLARPFFVLAPMDDVTDTVFRQVIASTAAPDLYFTEFVNVDALQSKGREATLPRLRLAPNEGTRVAHGDGVQGNGEQRTKSYSVYDEGAAEPLTRQSAPSASRDLGSAQSFDGTVRKRVPIVAQFWGLTPENFYKSAQDAVAMGYDAIDLNFGCPDKNVVRNGACSAFILPENRAGALEIIQATREGASSLPLCVKTRLGFSEVDLTWHELLLKQTLNMLTVHGRTKKQMSDVPADWDMIGKVRELRDQLSPTTLIVGNGDVLTRQQGVELTKKYQLDGIMVGRGIFQDPYVFAENSPWESFSREQKIALYRKHVELFAETWQHNERKVVTLNKFCKVYINGFDGAKELREQLMAARSTDDLLDLLEV